MNWRNRQRHVVFWPEDTCCVSYLWMLLVWIETSSGENLSPSMFAVWTCLYSQKYRQTFTIQSQIYASMIAFSFSCFIRITCWYQSVYKYILNPCQQVLVKICDQTSLWVFYLLSWIPTAPCKCLHLPFHLLFCYHFLLQNKGGVASFERKVLWRRDVE